PIPPVDQQNDYGFTLSGPIMIPKLFNGKNRLFFSTSQDWFKQNQAQNQIGTVPTTAMKNGDFSNFVNASGAQIPIYDPTTGMQFPGNIIPAYRFSALAKSILPLIPDPNTTGLVSGLQSNELPAVHSVAINQHLWSYTIDYNISSSQSIHWSQWRDSVTQPSFPGNNPPIVPFTNPLQSGANNSNLGSGFLLNYVKTITPHLAVTAGADWIGYITSQSNANQNVSFPGTPGGNTFPLIGFDGQNAPTAWGVNGGAYLACCSGGLTEINNRMLGLVAVNNWLWTKGRHTFNFGGQWRKKFQDIISCQFCSGTYNFSQRTTSIPNSNDPNFGSDGSSFASFLLGLADSDIRQLSPLDHLRDEEYALYAEDEIKVTDRLTVNLGLRWDIMVPFTETNNQIIYVNASTPDPGAGGIPGGATKFGDCAGCSGITRADIHWKNFQPRGGIAYRLNSKTVLRAGGYMTMLDGGAYEFGTAFTASFMSSLLAGTYLRNSSGGSVPGVGSWDTNPLPLPQPTPFSPSIGNGGVIFAFNPQKDGRAPYLSAWNAGVQRELPWKMFLTANYVGNRAIHLPTTLSLTNQPYPSVLQYGALLGEPVNSPAAIAAGIKIPYPGFIQQFGAAATVIQALTPFPQYSGFFPVYEMAGTTFYNAGQLQLEKRFDGGLSFLANLTMGRLMGNTAIGSAPYSPNGLNAFDSKPEYVPSFLDQAYSQKTVLTYELPVGYGKKYLNSRGIVSQILGGWQLSAILTYAGGFPFGAYNTYNPLLVNSFDRPDINPSVPLTTYSYDKSLLWFLNHIGPQPVQFPTNAFVNTGPWQLGDSLRAYAALRTPPLLDENIAAMKYFHIGERVTATLRIDYFNLFGRTQLQAPDNNSLDSTFGQVINLSSQLPNRQGQATFRLEF
ncbi:MAG: TonB-dependent receptor, partial [Acidobacteriaceae bacterium]|nr:TonB-dependent receptor [Acidobacteriaceae bacterium]